VVLRLAEIHKRHVPCTARRFQAQPPLSRPVGAGGRIDGVTDLVLFPSAVSPPGNSISYELVMESDIGFKAALEEAKKGSEEGGVPIGAALVSADGKVLGRGHNMRIQKGSATLHVSLNGFTAGAGGFCPDCECVRRRSQRSRMLDDCRLQHIAVPPCTLPFRRVICAQVLA
jgi:hypothetical protein